MATVQVPEHILKSKNWRSMLHLFSNHNKLQSVFTTKYIDFENETVKIKALKTAARPWSGSEKFMLNLAAHLFNEHYKVDLSGMDYLDANNTKLALEAIEMRYGSS